MAWPGSYVLVVLLVRLGVGMGDVPNELVLADASGLLETFVVIAGMSFKFS